MRVLKEFVKKSNKTLELSIFGKYRRMRYDWTVLHVDALRLSVCVMVMVGWMGSPLYIYEAITQ